MPRLFLTLFDDARARRWHPFTLTRPAGELLFGTLLLRERAERVFGTPARAQLTGAAYLHAFEEDGSPPVRSYEDAEPDGDRLFLLSRAAVDWSERGGWTPPEVAGPVTVGGRIAGWFAPSGSPPPGPAFLDDPDGWTADRPVAALAGQVLDEIWNLISGTAEQIRIDVAAIAKETERLDTLPAGVHHWGDHTLHVHPGARLEPGCAIDTTNGPVWLEEGTVVRAFTRLCGPAYIGRDSQVLGGSVECVSIGPVCRIRGEISSTVCLGYSNKQHDGHLGHAYLGKWVNLGAETTNSDLKNNYGSIRIWTPDGEEDTGEIKIGCLLGDHVKTGIGLLINTGTVVGTGSNLYGAEMPPKFVPPFSWGSGDELVEYRFDKFLEVVERAMARREVDLTDSTRNQLEAAFAVGREQARTASDDGG
jgi:UDP-N-acetylglucosamine diphosphorylase / glucose-1-phosphate thymidylyltransferase / UDP-N-acetylgalactosamine diphosphorylase / glucosamine-1-phosphate N-acetyltransferase / galactosamine-1-phosphate N-acetyltransferase